MLHKRLRLLGLLIAGGATMAASPFQAAEPFTMPWWGWLIVVAVVLLLAFVVFVSMDWSGAAGATDDEGEQD